MIGDGVHFVDRLDLRLVRGAARVEIEHAAAIATHWQKAVAASPALFDGVVLLLTGWQLSGRVLSGQFQRAHFRTVLWLRQHWQEKLGTWNAFGSALIQCRDGAVLLGRMAEGTANAGRVYCPGGILDEADIRGDRVDAEACVIRELGEETGLAPSDYRLCPGWLVARDGRAVSLARRIELPWTAEDAAMRLTANLSAQDSPELSAVHIVRSVAEGEALDVPGFTRMKLAALFGARSP